MTEIKLCECGCGLPAPIAKKTDASTNRIKGQPMRMLRGHHDNQWVGVTLEERFWAKVNKEGPLLRPDLGVCWVWTGSGSTSRYGHLRVEGKECAAHRVAWLLETGQWPNPCALHKCDNGLCVRFSHLFEGTHQDNMDDREAKGRSVHPKGIVKTCVHGITPKKLCRPCRNEYEKTRQRKVKKERKRAENG